MIPLVNMTNQQAQDNYRKARSTTTQNDVSCNTCEIDKQLCPNCRRMTDEVYPNAAPFGDVPVWRIKETDERTKKAVESKQVRNIRKPVAKKTKV